MVQLVFPYIPIPSLLTPYENWNQMCVFFVTLVPLIFFQSVCYEWTLQVYLPWGTQYLHHVSIIKTLLRCGQNTHAHTCFDWCWLKNLQHQLHSQTWHSETLFWVVTLTNHGKYYSTKWSIPSWWRCLGVSSTCVLSESILGSRIFDTTLFSKFSICVGLCLSVGRSSLESRREVVHQSRKDKDADTFSLAYAHLARHHSDCLT